MEFFVARMSPDNLSRVVNTKVFFSTMKAAKKSMICQGYMCDKQRPCRECEKLRGLLCKKYHMTDPAQEIAARLAFEGLFDMIPVQAIENGSWMDNRYRDAGHTMRMRILWRKAKGASDKYKWITAPRYM
jgi:hypothetical protein